MALSRIPALASFTLLAMLGMSAWFSPTAQACSCLVQEPLEALAASTTVFEGRVVAITSRAGDGKLDVKFAVLKAWKGLDVEKTVSVTTDAEGSMCGYSFAKKERYLVYALRNGDRLETSLCTRTRRLSQAQADLDAFKSETKDSATGSAAKTLATPGNAPPAQQAEQAAVPPAAPNQEAPPSEGSALEATKPPPAGKAHSENKPSEVATKAEPAAQQSGSCSVNVSVTRDGGFWLLALSALLVHRRRRLEL